MNSTLNTQILSWVSSIGEIEIPKEFNDYLMSFGVETLDKLLIDSMGTFEIYQEKEEKEENKRIYLNMASKKYYSQLSLTFSKKFS